MLERRNPAYIFVGAMLTLFGGLVAITAIPTLDDGWFGIVPVLVGGTAGVFGALVLYGSYVRRRR